MAYEDAFASSPHAVFIVMFFQALQASEDGWIFFWLSLFCAESVVAQRIQSDSLWLMCIEVWRSYWARKRLLSSVVRVVQRLSLTYGYELC